VNLSARLMQMACGPNSPSILIDEQTAMDAEQKIHSVFFGEKQVKGKDQLVNVFEPMYPNDVFKKVADIRTHY
jgi:class 3 adenylate cyclase